MGRYGLLNLFAGIRAPDGAWKLSFVGKNVTDTHETLFNNASPVTASHQALRPPTFRTTPGAAATVPYPNHPHRYGRCIWFDEAD